MEQGGLTVEIIATGPAGKSAYEAAKAHGYTGTEQAFGELLASAVIGSSDICTYPSAAAFPAVGSESKLYLDAAANVCCRWDSAAQSYRALGASWEDVTLLCGGGAVM